MNEITQKEILSSQRLACLESPSRRLLIKGDDRPWRDACVFLALCGYRCSDSGSSASDP
jgi:hypothetical protein